MFRLWCFCGWGKVKTNPIPIRCPRCGKKLHIAALGTDKKDLIDTTKQKRRYKISCPICKKTHYSKEQIVINCTTCATKMDIADTPVLVDIAEEDYVTFKYVPSKAPDDFVPIHYKSITVRTVQGIGDLLWVYKKLKPYFDEINLIIYEVAEDKMQERAKDFLKYFPGIKHVTYDLVKPAYYIEFAKRVMYLNDILYDVSTGVQEVEFVCNKCLEEGIRLEDIDPSLDILESVALKKTKVPTLPKKYSVIYISGGTCAKNMSVGKWVKLLTKYKKKYKGQLVFIGAFYDNLRIDEVRNALPFKTKKYIDYPADKVMYIISRSKFFIGIQSGICILADNMNIPQLMIYIPILDKLRYSWPSQKNIDDKVYNAIFDTATADDMFQIIKEAHV